MATVAARAEELFSRVIAPLVLGGPLGPVRPFGPRLAAAIHEPALADGALCERVSAARLRVARHLLPIDDLPPLEASEWALAAGLNDLLQLTHHELTGPLSRGRRARLADAIAQLFERVPVPRTVGEALARHATFSRVLELSRTDTEVTWWTGRASFRGQAVPTRLLAWPNVRQVVVTPRHVRLARMAEDLAELEPARFDPLLGALLAKSPLTDLANATRVTPLFAWTASTAGLVASPAGRVLALRVLLAGKASRALAALRTATDALADQPEPTRSGPLALLAELELAGRAA